MKRLFQSSTVWRCTLILLIAACAGIASAPPVLGSAPTLAVTQFANEGGAPQGTVSALSSALYDSIDQSGKFSAVGGGPLQIKPALDGSLVGPSVDAASKAGAAEVVVAELVSAQGGNVVYRLTAYRTSPLDYIRTQIFSQSSLSSASLTAGFVTNLATLHAPRAALGTIYSLTNGIHADLGSENGFELGQQFNVLRGGQKMASAQIVGITAGDATIEISNPVSGYKPQVGDALVGLKPLSALVTPQHSNNSFGTIFGLLVATGAALLSIGHHGQPAGASALPSPSPTSSGTVSFTVTNGTQTGALPNPIFTFTFSQPISSASFGQMPTNVNFAFFTTTNPPSPATQLSTLGPVMLDPTSTVLTVGPLTCNCLAPGETINFNFTAQIISTSFNALTPYNQGFGQSFKRHPATVHTHPVRTQGGALVPTPPKAPAPQQPNKPPASGHHPN